VQLPSPVAHVPSVAADGFDFLKPYEPAGADLPGASKGSNLPPKQPLRPVAALLGGLGKK
jgi:ATP-dependent RNA helicase RhlE